MKILITISTQSELIGYEALSLGFVLASLDHQVQFYLKNSSQPLFDDDTGRPHGMIRSLDLYDIPKAWADFERADFIKPPCDGFDDKFDAHLVF